MTETTKPAEKTPQDKQLVEELVDRARGARASTLLALAGCWLGSRRTCWRLVSMGRCLSILATTNMTRLVVKPGTRGTARGPKRVLNDVGSVEIEVPRDRDGSFEPRLVKKRQRRLSWVDEMVISLTAKGLTTGEVSAHMADVYGADVSKDTISRITDRMLDEMTE